MLDHSKAFKALSDFIHVLLTPYDLNLVLDDLAIRLCEILEITGTGVSLASDGHLKVATALPPEIKPVEDVQEMTQEGPCVTAFRASEAVVISDLEAADWRSKWPKFCAAAIEANLRAVAAIPMQVGGEAFGAVSLYSHEVKGWTDNEIFLTQTFADAATVYLLNASNFDRERALNEQLQHALESRVLIEQAKGILAEANKTDVKAAFEMMRNYSRNQNLGIRKVAEAIVERGLRL